MQETHVTLEQLAAEVALEAGFDEETARDYLETLFETLSEQMARKETVQLRDFGTFKTVFIQARDGRNPQTGDAITIPPHHNVHFSPSGLLMSGVNANYTHLAPRLIESRIYEEEEIEAENRYLIWIILGLLALLLAALAYWWMLSGEKKPEPEAQESPAALFEPIKTPEPAPVPVASTPTPTPAPVQTGSATHRVLFGETLWGISWNRWSDATLWPAIYGENRSAIGDPDRIFPGMTLIVGDKPDLNNEQQRLLLQDRFLMAYEAYKKAGKDERAVWLLYMGRIKYGLLLNWDDFDQITPEDRKLLKSFVQ